nr:hypothetical protein [Tanacetum cinerariifolium]
RDISSSSWLWYPFLDFQCPVFSSSLFEESLEDEPTLLRRLRRLSSESELGGLSLMERRRPSLSWTSRLPSLAWTLVHHPLFS